MDIKYLPKYNAVQELYAAKTGHPFMGVVGVKGEDSPTPGPTPDPPAPPKPEGWQLQDVSQWTDMDDGNIYFGIGCQSNKDMKGYKVYMTGTAKNEDGQTVTMFRVRLIADGDVWLSLDRTYAENYIDENHLSNLYYTDRQYTATAVSDGEGDTMETSGTWTYNTTLELTNVVVTPSDSAAGYSLTLESSWDLTPFTQFVVMGYDAAKHDAFQTFLEAKGDTDEDRYIGVQAEWAAEDGDVTYEPEYLSDGGTFRYELEYSKDGDYMLLYGTGTWEYKAE